jgi:hypothetical protein
MRYGQVTYPDKREYIVASCSFYDAKHLCLRSIDIAQVCSKAERDCGSMCLGQCIRCKGSEGLYSYLKTIEIDIR